jgi:hypothetical protein
MDTDEKSYLWQHFVFNAEQRLKAFNFFVVFSVFTNGGVFAAVEKHLQGSVFVLIGGFVFVLSVVFWIIDVRSQSLLQLAVPGLLEYEKQFDERSRLFTNDARSRKGVLRYTTAFRILFGIGVIAVGVYKWAS